MEEVHIDGALKNKKKPTTQREGILSRKNSTGNSSRAGKSSLGYEV